MTQHIVFTSALHKHMFHISAGIASNLTSRNTLAAADDSVVTIARCLPIPAVASPEHSTGGRGLFGFCLHVLNYTLTTMRRVPSFVRIPPCRG
ncbi:MAG: hypothetical protein KKC01_04250 [Gammaproteobacteria bacterium]|nr:hypothetical protein [Gammaproteobacteria bacterium]